MKDKAKVIGAVTFPLEVPFKVVKSYKRPLKTKLGPILFNAFKVKSTSK
jgi:hypothetical protein